MKNSIEEDIKNAEHFIKSIKTDKEYKEENGWHGYYNKEIVELARILEHILSDYKRVLKENEELKEIYRSEKKMKNEYVKLYQDLLLKENVIPIQKIKDKIEKILNNKEYRIVFEGNAEFPDDATIINAQKYIKLEKMQELIEESEEK